MNAESVTQPSKNPPIPNLLSLIIEYTHELAEQDFELGITHDPADYQDIQGLRNRVVAVEGWFGLLHASEHLHDEIAVQIALANIEHRLQSQHIPGDEHGEQ